MLIGIDNEIGNVNSNVPTPRRWFFTPLPTPGLETRRLSKSDLLLRNLCREISALRHETSAKLNHSIKFNDHVVLLESEVSDNGRHVLACAAKAGKEENRIGTLVVQLAECPEANMAILNRVSAFQLEIAQVCEMRFLSQDARCEQKTYKTKAHVRVTVSLRYADLRMEGSEGAYQLRQRSRWRPQDQQWVQLVPQFRWVVPEKEQCELQPWAFR